MKRISFALFFLTFVFFPINSIYAAIHISEIYPKTEDVTKQWIELYNSGNESVSLDRWRLENSSGEITSFILNASAIIEAHSFLLFYQAQTGINLNKSGDTVKLTDEKNNTIDQQRYEGILGYNMSVGNSYEGKSGWSICTVATPNQPNNCPTPTIIPVLPTLIPTETPIPIPTPTPTLAENPTMPPLLLTPLPSSINTITPEILSIATHTPVTQGTNTKKFGIIAVILSTVWIFILLAVYFHNKIKNHSLK